MKTIECTPNPSCLADSMRSVGYCMETAISDIIDNSISVKSKHIRILHDFTQDGPAIAILDDGYGMSETELIEAMRPGGKGPKYARKPEDLGRFGLGLKTASFSQCRQLTVISRKKKHPVAAAQWDLGQIEDSWALTLLDEEEILHIPFISHFTSQQGTLVVWQDLDRLSATAKGKRTLENIFLEQVENSRKHLSLVFHRFLSGQNGARKLKMDINGIPVRALDPYFAGNSATQRLPQETILIHDEPVVIRPYIIPHYSKLSGKERDALSEMGGATASQGFYVYRNHRLLARGDWFRLRRTKSEASALARVSIDIPNTHDELWNLDIKKSSVSPPEMVRNTLENIIGKIVDSSVRTYTSRGSKLSNSPHSIWTRLQGNQGASYAIDRDHPLIKAFCATLREESIKQFSGILDLMEKNFPLEAVYNDKRGGNLSELNNAKSKKTTDNNEILIDMMLKFGISEQTASAIMKALAL